MAGVDCRDLFTLMTTFFGQGTDFAEDPFGFLVGAPSIQPPLDLTETDTDDEEETKSVPSTHAGTAPASGASANPANASGWKDHMTSKHTGMPLYGSEVGPMTHPVQVSIGTTGESALVIGAAPLAASTPEPDPVDTLPYVPDVEEDEGGETEAPTETETTTESAHTAAPPQGIDSYSIKDIQYLMQFLPSDLRQYSYYGGGSWIGHIPKDDSQSMLSAADWYLKPLI